MSTESSALALINLGCGHVTPAGWINVDGSRRAWIASKLSWLDRFLTAIRLLPPTEFSKQTTFADLTKTFPWPRASVDAIYMGEILEHFTYEQGQWVLKECARVLRPSGIIRIRVPDNAQFWRNYLREYDAICQKPSSDWSDEHTRWIRMFFRDICVRPPRLSSMGHFHKWMYDDVSLTLALREAGFVNIARRSFHQSRIIDIEAIEVRDDLIIEALRA